MLKLRWKPTWYGWSWTICRFSTGGINRISIGVQSFGNDKLIRLGRIHDADEAKNAARLAKELGLRSFNLDLCVAYLTNHYLKHFQIYNKQSLYLPYLSWYQLTIEPNTQFGSRPPKLPDDDMLWDIFLKVTNYSPQQDINNMKHRLIVSQIFNVNIT